MFFKTFGLLSEIFSPFFQEVRRFDYSSRTNLFTALTSYTNIANEITQYTPGFKKVMLMHYHDLRISVPQTEVSDYKQV